ncbi:MAG TPA: sigma 54-interacting transcriptional regulator, partial [Gemmatimonadota bacterium]|nr:sigma 54-interacting transcriptional regulator [Gemmatimonadota bacterium]
LLESELFGHEPGAFTGATQQRKGKFELAGEGTLFLDEVAEIPPALQPKLLRALEEREINRLGGSDAVRVKARLVAATNRDLESAVAGGEFRPDLFYRLAVIRIEVPPLRDREGDVRRLVDHFVDRLGPEVGRHIDRVADETYERLEAYRWPGNVRELRNVVERSLILGQGATLRPEDLPELDELSGRSRSEAGFERLAAESVSLEEVERRYITAVLRSTGGNRTRSAEILGIHRSTLHRKIDDYGIDVPA